MLRDKLSIIIEFTMHSFILNAQINDDVDIIYVDIVVIESNLLCFV